LRRHHFGGQQRRGAVVRGGLLDQLRGLNLRLAEALESTAASQALAQLRAGETVCFVLNLSRAKEPGASSRSRMFRYCGLMDGLMSSSASLSKAC
jgi:hypothetical protein